ncbi:hypothetical protein AGMMS49938_05920 [Fibrobacterales bacterium]|nr:hypothetical protein AGMMS49938_05920 [Fibrobacterales bacterium]
MAEIQKLKEEILTDLDRRVADKILETSNAELLKKLISKADSLTDAIQIAELGTTYKRTGLHFDKRLDKTGDTIKYFKRNDTLSFVEPKDLPKKEATCFDSEETKEPLIHKLIIGDNYDALLNLLVQYRSAIDVIYIDPPYGKDSMGEFAKTNYNNALTRDNLLSMLYPRLVLACQLLSDNGVIFCSIDDRNQAYIKCLFDDVFEERNFICNFIWQKKTGASDANDIATTTEYVICFCKNKEQSDFAKNYESYDLDRYKYEDEFVEERGVYYIDNLDRGGLQYSDSLNYGIECPDGTITFPNGRTEYANDGWIWKWSKSKVEWARKNKFIEFRKSKGKQSGWSVCYKNYLKVDNENKPIERGAPHKNLITEILNANGAKELKDIFGTSPFKNPKPIELIKYFIKITNHYNSNPVILDFFAGSGTTGQAVLELNSSDNGSRQFILCTNNEITDTTPNGVVLDVTSKRLKRVMTGKCYDGISNFEWAKKNKPLGGSLEIYDIATVANFEDTEGKTPFEVIDETLYGEEKFATVQEKTEWVCDNFEHTQKEIESDEEWLKRQEDNNATRS